MRRFSHRVAALLFVFLLAIGTSAPLAQANSAGQPLGSAYEDGTVLVGYHVWCGRLLRDFAADRNTRTHAWYRWFNEFPTLVLFAAVLLVVLKPF